MPDTVIDPITDYRCDIFDLAITRVPRGTDPELVEALAVIVQITQGAIALDRAADMVEAMRSAVQPVSPMGGWDELSGRPPVYVTELPAAADNPGRIPGDLNHLIRKGKVNHAPKPRVKL